jgi:hypothetical protein
MYRTLIRFSSFFQLAGCLRASADEELRDFNATKLVVTLGKIPQGIDRDSSDDPQETGLSPLISRTY